MSEEKISILPPIYLLRWAPTSLADRIIDDLRVWDVLRLICHDEPKINAHIMSHPVCSNMFGADKESLIKWKFAADFYKEIFTVAKKPMVAPTNIGKNLLGLNIHFVQPEDYSEIWDYTRDRIHDEIALHWRKADLTRFGAEDHSSLHTDQPRSLKAYQSFEELKNCWEDIQKAKAKSFHLRSEELYWTADMLEANSDILKRTLDPEQAHRPNTAHILSRMRQSADKILRTPASKFAATEHFRYDFLGIIPFDSALDELLGMMQKHGLMEGDGSIANDTAISTGAASHPSSVINSVQSVIDGMPKVYILPIGWPEVRSDPEHLNAALKDGDLLRTANTPWSDQFPGDGAVSFHGPHFTTPKYGTHRSFWRPKSLLLDPHPNTEKAWLVAFVEVYRYLQNLDS
ncbi:uncharacterized protein N7511_001407 [Penicillium nucicola]|uniref:uncharacterized protein n=1 Tax=Penicillium nucicola TaxID=1850975 RepID=UPI0025450B7C|nr:uncharacterized protein N7511_001407 [Penicillium nucicola]KAJ5776396.1 hypothetical protein N7511_001407 [Penicillium nucicola]